MQYAIAIGVNTLEMDVSVTKDNVLVLSHDPHLLPGICLSPEGLPAPKVPIRSLTLQQLKKFDCGSLRNPRFLKQMTVPGTPPPTLMEVFHFGETYSRAMIRYSIETKIDPDWDPALTPSPEHFAALIDEAITTAGVGNRTIIQSFDPRTLVALKKRGSHVKTALLVGTERKAAANEKLFGELVGDALKIDADILSPEWHLVTPSLVKAAHAAGVAVIPWTVNDRNAMHKVLSANVDGMISDDVDLMMQIVKEEARPGQGACLQE
jgi:glycerophosphoryl diester phosphodiesterase